MTLRTPLELRSVKLRNRLGMAPMTQYMAEDFRPTSWHLAHYATRALTVGLVIVEATAVSRDGAVTPHDLALWEDEQLPGLSELAEAIAAGGAVPGLQLSHGGRKGSRTRWWDGDYTIPRDSGGWPIYGPSPVAFAEGYPVPDAMDAAQIHKVIDDFATAADRALRAGFRFLELHAGHGRLLHSFYSPVSNLRDDEWGGSFDNRVRLVLETVRAVRGHWPHDLPLAVRLSCVDWVKGGWGLDDSVHLAALLAREGVDLIDCSSGGINRSMQKEAGPGYQVPFAEEIRHRTGVATAAVGLIETLSEANDTILAGQADLVLMGRKLLLDPFALLRHSGWGSTDHIPLPYARGIRSLTAPERTLAPEL